jgi:hypothetical protein
VIVGSTIMLHDLDVPLTNVVVHVTATVLDMLEYVSHLHVASLKCS